jgi:hypothetical protein
LDIRGLLAEVESHALRTGRFDRVLRFEPEQPRAHDPALDPDYGLTCAIWMERLRPFRAGSGLAVTSLRMDVNVRVYRSMLTDPLDAVDPEMVEAVDVLLAAYSADFTLGGRVRNVDLLGQAGEPPLQAQAGYVQTATEMWRAYTIDLPLILSDVWPQSA